jgi:TRAP-type mannitol/chloroaromatic compound transport system substrate-binding protein
MLTGFPQNYVFNEEITATFIAEVEARTGMTVSLIGPEAVGTFDQFDPVSQGLFDLLITHPAYHTGTTSLGISIDAVAPRPEARREEGVFDLYAEHYRTYGVELIALPPLGSQGFQIVLSGELDDSPDAPLSGLKIRSVETYFPMLEAFGGAPVVMPAQDVYTALDRGVVDGAIWSNVGIQDLRWNEVADGLVRPLFGQTSLMIFASQATWNGLDDATRTALVEAGRAVEMHALARFDELSSAEEAALVEGGMTIVTLPDAAAQSIETIFSNGVWNLVEDRQPEAAEVRGRAVEAGLTE